MSPSIQMSGNIKCIHIRKGCTFQFGDLVLGGGLIRVSGKQRMPWSSCDDSFHLDKTNCIWNHFHLTCPHSVYWISFTVVLIDILDGICKDPHADGYPVGWSVWSTDNTHHLVLILQVMPYYCSTVPISEITALIFYPFFCYSR